ncbi:MAG: FKBP-type peptidyl-prolyl cis-trans isomerase [Bacteroidales bacterium]|jgi:FKBP-type peptidyl-prolyl cis-trans isomerase|nr:FKBP-type peptidyl-prolyl cis-trans isomerase [Bacteroidales bacterium]
MNKVQITKWFLLLFIFLFFSCLNDKQHTEFNDDENGFAIKNCRVQNKQPVTKIGDVIVGELQIRLNDSTILHNNYGNTQRLFKINNVKNGTIDKYLLGLHIGDSIIIRTPAHYLESHLVGFKFRPNDKLYFYLSVSQIITQKQLTEQEIKEKKQEEEEQNIISEYVKNNLPNAIKQENGIYIDIIHKTQGEQATAGSVVKVFYSVRDLTGKIYDTNIKSIAKKAKIYDKEKQYSTFEFIIDSGQTIAGFSEGVSLMHEGEKAIIIIPSKLAYGSEKNGVIMPNTTLIFEVELVSVK